MTLKAVTDFIKHRSRYHAVMFQLRHLNERDLADLGIRKADFAAIARGSYRRDLSGQSS